LPLHVAPGAQSATDTQLALHAPPEQRYGAHGISSPFESTAAVSDAQDPIPATHRARPRLHDAPGEHSASLEQIALHADPSALHAKGAHWLVVAAHRPKPSHAPRLRAVPLHVDGAHWPNGSGLPAFTGRQTPSKKPVSEAKQLSHDDSQAVSQQMPETQLDESQSSPTTHALPRPTD
jgi:hypothetical protein